MGLSKSQLLALQNITNYARKNKDEAKAVISHILKMSNISNEEFKMAETK